ncbi:hypothetical protein V7S57_09490 [Caulobacter sp. CCNWLY153]|uniref:hypothetical protein n=1 Tax=unclassified Caulobacter TaxID=2648921 RepID=UPI002FEEE5BB
MFGQAGGDLPMAGGGETVGAVEPYVAIELSGRAGEEQPDPAREQSAQIAQLLTRLRQADPEIAIPVTQAAQPRSSARSLFEAVEASRTRQSRGDQQGEGRGKGQDDRGGEGAGRETGQAAAKPAAGPRSASPTKGKGAGGGGLFGFVEPCWKQLPGRSTVPVQLEVTLDHRGLMAAPPRIVRPESGPPGEARLVAEARAIAALSACLPYTGSQALTRQAHRVDFPAA